MTKSTLMSSAAALALLGTIMVSATAYAQDEEVPFGPETYEVDDFDVDSFIGTIEILVEDRSTIEVSAVGSAEHMENFHVDQSGDAVEVSYDRDDFRWNDWSTWVSWWGANTVKISDYPVVTVRVPEGTSVEVDSMTGNFTAGDLNGELNFDGAGAIDATIGTLQTANIDVAGAADITLGDVAGSVTISIAGAADVHGQSAGSLDLEMSGASDVSFGHVANDLDISIAGVGDVDVTSVNGVVDISIAGAGEVSIDEGRAEEFDVSISGSGEVFFGGTAVDPDISIAGSGEVRIHDYEGELDHSGMGHVEIGS